MSQHRAAPGAPQQQSYSESWPPAEGYQATRAAPKRRKRLLWLVLLGVLVIAATAAAVAGWASGHPSVPAGRTADNVRVCQHYRVQRADVKNLAEPSLADVVKLAGWIGADDGQSTPGTSLRRDFDAWVAAMRQDKSVYAVSGRVLHDCAAIGVAVG